MNIFTLLPIIFLLIVLILFIFKSKIVLIMNILVKISFVFLFILAIASVFFPQLFPALADVSLKRIGTYKSIKIIDENSPIETIENASKEVLDTIREKFNLGNNEDVAETESEAGFFESSLYPGLVGIIAFVYRILALIISFVGLIIVVYLDYTTGNASDVEKVKQENKDLRKRVEVLEENSL